MAKGSRGARLQALAAAVERLGERAYVMDRGPRAPPALRFEAGALDGVIGFRTRTVYAPSWEELPERLARRAQEDRQREATGWAWAAVRAAAEGFDVRGPCAQLQAWVEQA